ncbi:MAG: phosphotransferase, partial [Chthonomonadales bacterium]|nr:phosphotransferase [Chthonomonadales bacterium]
LVKQLLEGDADSSHVALVALARRLGAMHASAMGKDAQSRAIRHNLSPEWVANGIKSPEAQQEAREKQASNFADSCRGLGIEVDEAAQQELLAALLRVDEPGPFLTFLHCDPCPDNDFYQDGELRLIDFEFSAFGHALRDGIYGRLPFPTCWCANTVPAATVREMEDAYRLELADVCPEIREDERFLEEATAVAASWTIGTVQWHLKEALEEDRTWGIAGTRARIFTRITMLLDTARSADQMPALCSVLEKALTELQSRWPEATPLPLYPAFRSDI